MKGNFTIFAFDQTFLQPW